jgi:hypothetical protein
LRWETLLAVVECDLAKLIGALPENVEGYIGAKE